VPTADEIVLVSTCRAFSYAIVVKTYQSGPTKHLVYLAYIAPFERSLIQTYRNSRKFVSRLFSTAKSVLAARRKPRP